MAIIRKGEKFLISDKDVTGELQDLQGRQSTNVNYQTQLNDIKLKLREMQDTNEHPNAQMHQIVSFIKSAVRILGYCFIPYNLVIAAIILILSEVIGIIEELV